MPVGAAFSAMGGIGMPVNVLPPQTSMILLVRTQADSETHVGKRPEPFPSGRALAFCHKGAVWMQVILPH
jgi:hypothetical protein